MRRDHDNNYMKGQDHNPPSQPTLKLFGYFSRISSLALWCQQLRMLMHGILLWKGLWRSLRRLLGLVAWTRSITRLIFQMTLYVNSTFLNIYFRLCILLICCSCLFLHCSLKFISQSVVLLILLLKMVCTMVVFIYPMNIPISHRKSCFLVCSWYLWAFL